LAFITSNGLKATWVNGARQEKEKRTALCCGDEVLLTGANDYGDDMGVTQEKRQPLKETKSVSMQVGDGDEGRVAEQLRCGNCLCTLRKPMMLALRNKLTVASADNVEELDAEEFFDFCVPASVLREFMGLTPVEVTSSNFCDLRFLKMLEHLCVLEPMGVDMAWLLAHYKTRMHTKMVAFDIADQFENCHSRDQGTMCECFFTWTACVCESVCTFSFFDHDARLLRCVASSASSPDVRDVKLASKYKCLKPEQVAMCRGNIESTVIQYCVWCPEGAAAMQHKAVGHLDQIYGQGLGGELWEKATALFESYYPPALWQSETGFGRWRRMHATKHTKRLVACIRGRNWYATKHTKRRESALDQEKELKSLRDLIRPLALAIPCQALTQAFATQQGSLHRSSVAAQLQHPNVRGFVGKIKPT
jgi:hypothetical protein